MENNSCVSKAVNHTRESPQDYDDEQSSWTFYLEHFMFNDSTDHDQYSSSFSSGCKSLNLVSDAASFVPMKLFADEDPINKGFCLDNNGMNSSFKRQRIKEVLVDDDDLEDTASSPMNSPKVSYLNPRDMNRKENNHENNPKVVKDEENSSGQINKRILRISGRDKSYAELKKRGLCLVPVSVLANYIS